MLKKAIIIAFATALVAAIGCKKEQVADDPPPTEQSGEEVPAETPPNETEMKDAAEMDTIPAPPHVDAAPPNAERSGTGLAWIVLEEGEEGTSPTIDSTIVVHYTGWTTEGEMFDSAASRSNSRSPS